jgi:hypothetical protein
VHTVPVAGYLARIELRRRRRALLLLALLTAAVVALALASIAGARRAETAFDRYVHSIRPPHVGVQGEPDQVAELADMPAVERLIDIEIVGVHPRDAGPDDFFPFFSSARGELGTDYFRMPIVEGRRPSQDEPLEIAVGENTAERLDLHVGGDLPAISWTPEGAGGENGPEEPDGPPLTFEVVGIVREPGDIGGRETDIPITMVTRAFRETYGSEVIGALAGGGFVVLRDGYTARDLASEVGPGVELDASFLADAAKGQVDPTMRAIASGLRIFAGVVALAGLIAIAQAAARLQAAQREDDAALAALGAGRAPRFLRLALPSLATIVGGVALGVAGAVALSPRFPIGLARRADPDLGVHVDVRVLLIGAAVGVVLLAALIAASAVWSLRIGPARASGPARAARFAANAGAPPSVVTGLALAGGPSGPRSGLAVGGTLLGVLGVVAALVFAASVDRLRSDPALYGWGWDANVEGAEVAGLGDDAEDVAVRIFDDPEVEAVGDLYTQIPVTLDGDPEYGTVVIPQQGTFEVVVIQGADPVRKNEIALGRDTLRRIDAEIGDHIDVGHLTGTTRMQITGVVAFPVPVDGGSFAAGALISPATFDPEELDVACQESENCTNTLAVQLADGVDAEAFASRYNDPEVDVNVSLPAPPGDIDQLTAVQDLPQYLAGFLALLGAAAISFATATTVRQRRRDLAVLRVLGMTRRHVRSVVVFFVVALSLSGAVLGAGLGLVVGRQVWRAIASSVAVPFAPSMPVAAVILVPIAALLMAQVVATRSRVAATQMPAATVLRAE